MTESKIEEPPKDSYRLKRDIAATTRLNLQHYIWKENIGYLIHPSVDVSSPTLTIADVGTGTGLWLTDLARQFPNAQLHGFDISSEQYIAAGFLPSNVSLRILDIFKDIPEEYVGKYDIVHARLLVQVVNQLGGDPLPVLKNLIKLLKPGGYLQWEEPDDDPEHAPVVKSDPSNVTENTDELMRVFLSYFASKVLWTADLGDKFKDEGLQNIASEVYPTSHYLLSMEQNNYLGVFEELVSKLKGSIEGVLSARLDGAIVEARKGLSWQAHRLVFVGQKPQLNGWVM